MALATLVVSNLGGRDWVAAIVALISRVSITATMS